MSTCSKWESSSSQMMGSGLVQRKKTSWWGSVRFFFCLSLVLSTPSVRCDTVDADHASKGAGGNVCSRINLASQCS